VVAVADSSGRVVAAIGDPGLPVFVRSAAKPFQALTLFESGALDRFGIPPDELAIVIASHSGEEFHIRLVESLLLRTGVHAEWLRCGVHPPFDTKTRAEMIRRREAPTQIHNNCSGKHVGMLASALVLREPVDGYLDPAHPIQIANRRLLASLSDLPADAIGIGIDGCSAPAFRIPLARFATAFARLTACGTGTGAEVVPGLKAVWTAMVDYPEIIAGTRERLDTALMRAARDAGVALVAKAGAEGTYAIGVLTPRGPLGIALKIEDGSERARNAAAVETLAQLGVLGDGFAAAMREVHRGEIRNRAGLVVGAIRPDFHLVDRSP
jgi:L-asparaginase II